MFCLKLLPVGLPVVARQKAEFASLSKAIRFIYLGKVKRETLLQNVRLSRASEMTHTVALLLPSLCSTFARLRCCHHYKNLLKSTVGDSPRASTT